MIQCRKEAPELTALATCLTRCHLMQLHCWAKINSLMTSALFISLFIYLALLYLFLLSLFMFLPVLMDLFYSSLFPPMWQQSEYHQFARKLVCVIFVIIDMGGGRGCVSNTRTCPLLVSLKPKHKLVLSTGMREKPWHDLLSSRLCTCHNV